MTESEIIEDNRLIAEFDGCKIEYIESIQEDWVYIESGNCRVSHLQYHKSFDWLMPVWHKIREIDYSETKGVIGLYSLRENIRKALCNGTIELAFTEIVAFIKWYNSIKTK